MFKCLVVDDELPAREELLYILEGIDNIEIIGQASHGMEALELINKLEPDIVFLDIQMPQMSGIEVARQLIQRDNRPMVIFVTAYDQFAIKAFEVNAIDYLLKPVSEDRLRKRLSDIIKNRKSGTENNRLDKLLEYMESSRKTSPQWISLYHQDRLIPLEVKDIIYITIEDRNTIVYSKKGKFESSHTLNELVEKLDPNIFFRSHKSYIVNLKHIEFIEPWFNSTYNIHLKNSGEIVPVSRYYGKEFRKIMNMD